MARVVRSMLEVKHGVYVIVIEHDLSVLDYLSDFICCLYGVPGAYGVVTMPSSVREGINIFLAGFIPTGACGASTRPRACPGAAPHRSRCGSQRTSASARCP